MLSKVCLVVLSLPRLDGEKMSVVGLIPKALKKLKGARFGFPLLSIVLAKAIGRGAIDPRRNLCNCGFGMLNGLIFIVMIFFIDWSDNFV